jgi:hypothetical protein
MLETPSSAAHMGKTTSLKPWHEANLKMVHTWRDWIAFCSAQLVFLFTVFYYPVILSLGHNRESEGKSD